MRAGSRDDGEHSVTVFQIIPLDESVPVPVHLLSSATEAPVPVASRQPQHEVGSAQHRAESIWAFNHQIQVLCRTAFDGLFLVDDERRYLRVNAQAAELLGAPVEDVLTRRIEDFTPPGQLPLLEQLWAQLEREGTLEGRYEVLRGDGSFTVVEFQASWNFGPGEHLIVAREVRPAARSTALRRAGEPDVPRLSQRECQVLQLAAQGRSTREIAEALFLSPGTVKTHFQHIYRKLGTCDRASAVAECLRRGLIE